MIPKSLEYLRGRYDSGTGFVPAPVENSLVSSTPFPVEKETQPTNILSKIILIPILLIVVFYFVDIFLRKKMWERIFKKISFNTVILLIILFILLAFIVFPKGNKTDENTKLASPPKATPTKLIKPYYLK